VPDWQDIYERHSTAVWKTAWRILRDRDCAADCVQETFLAALTLAQKHPIREWEGLLVSVAVRRALDQLRTRCRARQRQSHVGLLEIHSSNPTPEQTAMAAELADRLREALVELPALQAEVFCLRAFNDLSYHEIAVQLELDDQHVGVLLHRARQDLQRRLDTVCNPTYSGDNP
jgi:RNA polymerase sigma-70 factor, ECF subfamily